MLSASAPDASDGRTATGARARWTRILPVVVSVVLVSWLLWRVPYSQLIQVADEADWRTLVPLTAILVTGLYLWDAVCVRWIFAQPIGSIRYRLALRARGSSYLAGAVNYSLGQGLLAWIMARELGISLVAALTRLVVLAYHDLWLLLAFGLLGSAAEVDPRFQATKILCASGLGVLAVLTVAIWRMPAAWRGRMQKTRWAAWMSWWTWDRSLRLLGLRLVNFAISTAYAGAGLYLCNVPWHTHELFRAISLIQLTEALPITVSGLGTRETILIYVLNPAQSAHVLAFGLVWSTGLIAGRLAIGLLLVRTPVQSVGQNRVQDDLASAGPSARMKLCSNVQSTGRAGDASHNDDAVATDNGRIPTNPCVNSTTQCTEGAVQSSPQGLTIPQRERG